MITNDDLRKMRGDMAGKGATREADILS
jgi:hypothetical protein